MHVASLRAGGRTVEKASREEGDETMMPSTTTYRLSVAITAATLLTGCISFNGKEIRRPEVESVETPYAIVELEVAKFDTLMNGKEEGFGAGHMEGTLGRGEAAAIADIWKSKRLIEEYGWPGDLDADDVPTHRLVLSGTSDQVGSIGMSFLTGLTLYLVPSSSSTTTDIDVTLIRLADGKEFTATARNSTTMWQQIIFLPTSLFGSAIWGLYGAATDRSLHLYDQFEDAGAFERPEGEAP